MSPRLPGSGRKPIPGGGAVSRTVTLSRGDWAQADYLGLGNTSLGLRIALADYRGSRGRNRLHYVVMSRSPGGRVRRATPIGFQSRARADLWIADRVAAHTAAAELHPPPYWIAIKYPKP